MKRILAAGALLAGTALSAQAADLAVKPYTKATPMAAVYDWTGFYVGVNAGVGLGRDRTDHIIGAVPSADRFYMQPQGGIGGAQIGYNWQTRSFLGDLVFGIEADIQGTGMRDSFPSLFTITTNTYDQRLDWFGTVRGRVGIATGPALGYVTAGYAYGNVKTSVTEAPLVGAPLQVLTGSRTQGGWTWGSGVEAQLGGNWTGKLEYLYVNLGDKSDFIPFGTQTINTQVRENIFRAGLNYRIGGNNPTPVVASNWTGFYLGGNFGSGTGRDHTSISSGGTTESFNLAPDGLNGGIQAGYNWQAANWVFGLEADIQGASQRDNKTCVITCSGAALASYDATLPWFGTARGRLGYSVGPTLFYATGGYAYGGVKENITFTGGGVSQLVSLSRTKGGWTAGAGIESPLKLFNLLGPNWTTKTEYLYVDLGSSNDSFVAAGAAVLHSTRVQEHIFRTGVNYNFNTPVVAKY